MAEQDWLTPATAPGPSPYYNVAADPGIPTSAYELRPLSLGELLDRTFSLFRSRFWLFAGIAAVSSAVNLVMNVVQLIVQHFSRHNVSAVTLIVSSVTTLLVLAVYFLAYSITQAATIHAMSEVYLGRETTIGGSLRATAGRWYVYAAIALWQWWSFVWVPILLIFPGAIFAALVPSMAVLGGLLIFAGIFGGLVFGLVMYLRNSLAIQATVVEVLKVRKSMRRSKDLASGAKWRIFVIGLLSFALYLVVLAMQSPLLYLILMAARKGSEAIGAQAGLMAISFLGSTVISPVVLIGLSLVYFDQRVRKEAFDVAVLLGETTAVDFGAAAYVVEPPPANAFPPDSATHETARFESPPPDAPRATTDDPVL